MRQTFVINLEWRSESPLGVGDLIRMWGTSVYIVTSRHVTGIALHGALLMEQLHEHIKTLQMMWMLPQTPCCPLPTVNGGAFYFEDSRIKCLCNIIGGRIKLGVSGYAVDNLPAICSGGSSSCKRCLCYFRWKVLNLRAYYKSKRDRC